jgi:CRISPR/Cas system Type II protein with McrA/HNH and RuvC-like nuclease domain
MVVEALRTLTSHRPLKDEEDDSEYFKTEISLTTPDQEDNPFKLNKKETIMIDSRMSRMQSKIAKHFKEVFVAKQLSNIKKSIG